MRNITAQYRDLQEGKITKANFMTSVRMQFPDYISPLNSYEDMVKILKSKRILSEDYDTMRDLAGLSADAEKSRQNPKIQSIAKSAAQMSSTEDEASSNAIKLAKADGITSSDDITNIIVLAVTNFKLNIDRSLLNPDTAAKKVAKEHPDLTSEDQNKALEIVEDMMMIAKIPKKEITGALMDPDWPSEFITALKKYSKPDEFDEFEKLYNKHKMYKAPDHQYSPFNETTKRSLKEAANKSEGSYKKVTGKEQYSVFNEIDRVNPYEFRKGINIETGMQYNAIPNYFTEDFNPETVTKTIKKVLENLQKDPAYYTNMISMVTEKRTNMYQKPKEVKVQADGHSRVKGFTDAKSNTETKLGKKEKGSKSPEGVKVMKSNGKLPKGVELMKSNGKLPKGVELMKEEFRPGVNMGSAFDKFKQDITGNKEDFELADENAFENIMKKYDWYAEMSDDTRKWDAQQIVNMKLKDLGKKIGVERAVELFNQYAPKDRKVSATFFSIRESKIDRLKEYLKTEVRRVLKEVEEEKGPKLPNLEEYWESLSPEKKKEFLKLSAGYLGTQSEAGYEKIIAAADENFNAVFSSKSNSREGLGILPNAPFQTMLFKYKNGTLQDKSKKSKELKKTNSNKLKELVMQEVKKRMSEIDTTDIADLRQNKKGILKVKAKSPDEERLQRAGVTYTTYNN